MPLGSAIALVVARAAAEAMPLALVLVWSAAPLGGAIGLLPAWSGVGGALALLAGVAMSVDRRRVRLGVAGATVAATLGVAWLTAEPSIALASLASRALVAALAGAALLWRGFAIPEGAHTWRAMSYASLGATLAAAAATFTPAARADLPPVALVTAGLVAMGLSVARGSEELLAERRRGRVRVRAAAVAAMLLGLAAIAAVALGPLFRRFAETVAPALESLLFAALVLLVTPFAYVAEWLVPVLLAIGQALQRAGESFRLPSLFGQQRDPVAEEEYARQLAAQSEFVLRALVVLAIAIALAFLVMRYLLSRRVLLPEGASFERSAIDGMGLGELLRRMTRRPRDTRPPRPSGGDAAARVRRAYWDLLDLAERAGGRWRASHETPGEHLASLGDRVFKGAADVVRAFERVRYGDRASDADAAAAEAALGDVRRAVAQRA